MQKIYEIMTTLKELTLLREREDHVEFKRAKHNYPFAGGQKTDPKERRRCVLGYIVALANEKGGRLVLGMEDAYPHQITGSDFAENAIGALEDEIYERLHIRVRTEELYDEHNNRVLVINIPSRPIGKALRFEGVPLMRIGDSLREMDDAEYFSIISEQDPDFSAKICKGLKVEDLDEEAINNMCEEIEKQRHKKGVSAIPLRQLLRDLQLMTDDGKLKYAALLLLGKESAINKYLPQANVVIEYRTSRSQVRYSAREEYRLPLFVAINRIWQFINQPACNPLLHIKDLPRILDCPAYNYETVREAIINAMIHRSLQMNSDIFIKLYPDMLEIINPGGFPYGVNIGNILTVNSSPRSRLMAEVIEKTGLIERSGQGVDIMVSNCIKESKPLPDYSYSDDYQVDLRLYGRILDDAFYLFVQDLCKDKELENEFSAFEWLALYYVWKGESNQVDLEILQKLKELGLIIEDEYFQYVLNEKYIIHKPNVRNVAKRADINNIAKVYYVIKRNGEAKMSDFVKAFDAILSQKQVRTLIESLCQSNLLSAKGRARATKYTWVEIS